MSLDAFRTRLSDECASDLQLDRLILGERLPATEQHVAGCARCQARRSELEEQGVLFLQEHPAVKLTPRATSRRTLAAWSSTVLLAAAALLLFLRTPQQQVGSFAERTKGNRPSIGFYVQHAGSVRRGQPGERVAPQDALRFVVTSQRAGFWAILSRDAAGQVSQYFPSEPSAARVQAGVERALDASVVLDDVLGREQLYALYCERAIELTPLLAALKRTAAEPAWPDGCQVERLSLLKEAAQ